MRSAETRAHGNLILRRRRPFVFLTAHDVACVQKGGGGCTQATHDEMPCEISAQL